MLGPFEPSAGKGPAVSWGIRVQVPAALVAVDPSAPVLLDEPDAAAVVDDEPPAPVDEVLVSDAESDDEPQPASSTRPAPMRPRARRRSRRGATAAGSPVGPAAAGEVGCSVMASVHGVGA
jgi:hypothetical protein